MNIDPKGSIPATGIIKDGDAYQGDKGIGLGILLTLHGGSYLPTQCRPKIVPHTDNGNATKIHMPNIFKMIENGIALMVP
mmetsp:Transcript_10094/g.9791  ORF Transcript_10094/g.9791 Transcript_10094/m.9791 type:complete len:80 (+) Transcript_10094:827-1066(+)